MKEQTDSHSFASLTDSHERQSTPEHSTKKSKNSKTRHIQKERANMGEERADKEKIKLTKEQRAKIQKQKNREAAQRSRDMHKEYVTNLEQEVRQLKQELRLSRKYCHRCRQSLDNSDTELLVEENVHQNFENWTPTVEAQSQHLNSSQQRYSQPDSFLRVLEPQEQNSILKMMLFVCMIIIAVMVGFNKEAPIDNPRNLVQLYTEQSADSFRNDAAIVNPGDKCEEGKGLVELHRDIQDPMCLDSLMRIETPTARKSLRSIHDQTYSEEKDAIMLCSLRYPKSYEIQPELTQTPLVRLFVLGSQIKELLNRSGSWMSLLDKNIQLNGIYRLSAEIKNVDLVPHHNCLL